MCSSVGYFLTTMYSLEAWSKAQLMNTGYLVIDEIAKDYSKFRESVNRCTSLL